MKTPARVVFGILALVLAIPLLASDHADPMVLEEPNANITDLFFYPKDDRMILIFNVRRALTAPKPYDLAPYEYVIHIDTNTPVTFEEENRLRYGGTVSNPGAIKENISFRFRLNDDATLKSKQFTGLTDTDQIEVYTGVREDPFIFPRFFKRNAISTVLSIPRTSFPPGKQDFIIWGSVYEDGEQIDHVGRSNRTQLGRFDFLNTLPPNEHVPAIMEKMKSRDALVKRFNKYKETQQIGGLLQYVYQIRKYDLQPDVMIYSSRYPAGFPNGRQLPDDPAGETCKYGDCVLQELAYIEGEDFPRRLTNDKEFLPDFPYLAEPYPDNPAQPAPAPSIYPTLFMLLLIVLLVVFLILWLVYKWGFRRGHAAA